MRLDLARSGSWIGMAGIAMSAFLYGYTAVAFPSWAHSALMPGLWLLTFALGCVWFLSHPYRVLLLPVAAVAVWFSVILSGG